MSAGRNAAAAADRAGQSDWLELLARVGLIAYGIVHVLIGWLALQLAFGGGGGGESADQSGALATLAETPVGGPLLWVLGLGLFALALWQAAEALRWRQAMTSSGKRQRDAVGKVVKSLVKAILYVLVGVLALQTANGTETSSESSTDQAAEGVLGLPGGRFLVGAAALAVLAVAVYLVRKGWTKKFLEGVDTSTASPSTRRWIERLGQVGYAAKGVALFVVGGLLAWAAVAFDADKAAGLDSALRTVQEAPFGKWLLALIALGLVAFGIFCFARARYPERA